MTDAATTRSQPDLHELAQAICGARAPLPQGEQRTALALYALLAEGEPVAQRALAERLSIPEQDVDRTLRAWPEVIQDERGRIVAFAGLSLSETPHRFTIDGRDLYTWCAWDTLFMPELLGRVAEVRSHCPSSDALIELTVSPQNVTRVAPALTVVSMLFPREDFGDDVIARFCCHVHFFSAVRAAEGWLGEHPGTFTLSVDHAFELARLANRITFARNLD